MPEDEWCMHDQLAGTCTICSGKDVSSSKGSGRQGGSTESLDTPHAVEKYRSYYGSDRQETFDAYVDVFFRLTGARNFPGGFTSFTRSANAEKALAEREPKLVERAEKLMRDGGYVADDRGRSRSKGRRWRKEG